MPVFGVLFLVLQIAPGFLLSAFLDPEKKLSRAETLFASVALGSASSAFLLLSLLLITRSWSAALPLLWISLIASGVLVLLRTVKGKGLSLPAGVDFRFIFSGSSAVLLALLLLYYAILLGVFFIDELGFPSAILKGWGDVAYHLDMIGRLKTADPFVLEHPIVSGGRLTYPFMINLLSALYERIGFSKSVAWHLPVFLFGTGFFFLIFLLGNRIYRDAKFAAVLVLLVFFGGGIGFLWFFQDIGAAWQNGGADAVVSTLTDPPHEYTHLDNRTGGKSTNFDAPHNIVWIVPAVSFLSHQRSFVFGASVAVLLFLGFLLYRGSPKLWRWGILWGMIPFLHAHTFIAVSIIIAFWFFYDIKNWVSWLKGGVLGGIIALPQILFLMPEGVGSEGSSFFRPWLGWMTCPHGIKWYACDPGAEGVDSNPLWFWTKNFGFVFFAWIIGVCVFFLSKRNEETYSKIKPFLLPSLVLFLLPNVMLFQPWEFDNNKILYYWWIFAIIISLFLFQTFWSRTIVPFIFIVFVALSAYSGMIDVLARVSNFSENHHGYYGTKEVKMSEWIRENTEPNDRFLSGDGATQFIPMLAGRPIYLGYPGWLWTQGKSDLTQFRGARARSFLLSGNPSQVCEDGIKYVLWDNDLLRTYPGANRSIISSAAEVVFSQNLGYEKREILEIKCPE